VTDTVVELFAGNERHAAGAESRFDNLQETQRPAVVTVCCADSRVLGNQLWDVTEPGDCFSVRNVGNRVIQRPDPRAEPVVSGDVLYPLVETETETAVVVGHTGCGAVTATYDAICDDDTTRDTDDERTGTESLETDDPPQNTPPGIGHCISLLRSAVSAGLEELPASLDRTETVNRLVERNVDRQVTTLRESDHVPASVTVAGAVYDFHDAYDGRRGEAHLINLDGETDPDSLRAELPALADRIHRLDPP
jgi:carbonic anhydrase